MIHITLNGDHHSFNENELSYEKIIELAGYAPNRVLSITYSQWLGKDVWREGSLRPGKKILDIENVGIMHISCMDTSNA